MNLKVNFSLFASLIFLGTYKSFAETIPKDSSQVNFINVYFEEDFKKEVTRYQLQIFKSQKSLMKDSAIVTLEGQLPSFTCTQLNWGNSYYWRINTLNKKNKRIETGKTHTFKIIPKVNSDFFSDLRLDVKTNTTDKHAGGFILIDYLRGIYNREGQPLWVLPNIAGFVHNGSQIRDLEFTPDNTITFLSNNIPLEIDLHCNVLWTLPNPYVFKNDTIYFHHDLKKTKQGTYFMLANKAVYRPMLIEYTDSLKKLNRDVIVKNDKPFIRTEIPVLLELSHDGKVLWYWDSDEYIQDIDLNFRKTPNGFPIAQPHANALGVNEENTKVYLGFRDLSRIIKIDKGTKKVELSFGQKYPSGEAMFADNLFKQQHDARVTNHNSILILNNNGSRKNDEPSAIMELRDNVKMGDSVLIWRFDLNFDTLTNGKSYSGGNVTELPNSNLLLCAGQLNRIFEVSRKKEIVWDAFIYAYSKQENVWQSMPNYRGAWINDFEIKHFPVDVINFKNKKNNCQLDIEIHNVNKFSEALEIEITQGGKTVHSQKTETIMAGKKLPLNLNFSVLNAENKPLIFTIKESGSQNIAKQIYLSSK